MKAGGIPASRGAAELKDVLEEIRPEGDKKKGNIMTDENGDGEISYEEFAAMMLHESK